MTFHIILAYFALMSTTNTHTADDYEPGPDSKPQPGMPKGEVLKFSFEQSKIFPGTDREYTEALRFCGNSGFCFKGRRIWHRVAL